MVENVVGTVGTAILGVGTPLPLDDLSKILQSFISSSSDSFIVTDADIDGQDGPIIQFANHTALDYIGYAETDLIGRRLSILYAPDVMAHVLDDMREARRTGRSITRERQVLTANGRVQWLEINALPVADAEGRVTRFIRAGRNITARKRAEMQRESSERLLASVLGVAREAMVVIAGTGHIALANTAFTRRFGWTGAEVDSTLWQDYLAGSNPERVMGEITDAKTGPVREVMATVRHLNGTSIPCLLIVNTVRQPDNRLYYVLIISPDQSTHGQIAFEDSPKPPALRRAGQEPMHEIVYRRNGAATFFCLLHPPLAMRERLEKARGVTMDEHGRPIDSDLLMLRWAAEEAARDHAAGGQRYFGMPLDYSLFDSHERTEAYLDLCRRLTPQQHNGIVPILRHIPPHTNRERLSALVQILKPYTRYVGFEYVELGGAMGGGKHNAALVTIAADRLQEDPRLLERLDKLVSQFHMDGARVLVHRLAEGADPSIFLKAGVDILAGEGAHTPDSPAVR